MTDTKPVEAERFSVEHWIDAGECGTCGDVLPDHGWIRLDAAAACSSCYDDAPAWLLHLADELSDAVHVIATEVPPDRLAETIGYATRGLAALAFHVTEPDEGDTQ